MQNNKLIFLIMIAFVIVSTSCSKTLDSEGISRITEYPVFTIVGDEVIAYPLGTSYVDPGATATVGGADVDVKLSVEGRYTGYKGTSVNTDVADEYSVIYSAVNNDDIEVTATRTVMVTNNGDLVNSIEGAYWCTTTRSTGEAYSGIPVMIMATGTDTYTISHGIGGWYAEGRGYGDAYRVGGVTITVNDYASNDFTFSSGFTQGWPNEFFIDAITLNPGNKSMIVDCSADFGGVWQLELVQMAY